MWNVLIAEDDQKSIQDMKKSLESHAKCSFAASGEEALLSYRKAMKSNDPYDFILLDVKMPGSDGFEVLKAIREEEKRLNIDPNLTSIIIMVTTYKDSLMDKYNMGWDDFITKPVEGDKIINHMQAIKEEKEKVG